MGDETVIAEKVASKIEKLAQRKKPILATLVAVASLVTAVWQASTRLLAPWMIGVAQDALAVDIDKKIDAKLQPAMASLRAPLRGMIESKVDELDDQVQLEQLRKQQQPLKWQQIDELRLAQMKRRLQQEIKKLEKLDP